MQQIEEPVLLLCTDMDRTVIPNGDHTEDPLARERLRRFCELPQVRLVYVTGRDMELVEEAIHAYALPMAEFVISDVGTRICQRENGAWHELSVWREMIAQDWKGRSHADLQQQLQSVPGLQLQEQSRQSAHKLSYYLALDSGPEYPRAKVAVAEATARLQDLGVEANIVWSIDEPAQRGLLDVLPQRASKLHAIRYLQRHLGLREEEVLFAGDSGNDLDVLASELNAVLVDNASEDVRHLAVAMARQNGNEEKLFLAGQQSELGMNGNYAAGVLQGVLHFAPHFREALLQTGRRNG